MNSSSKNILIQRKKNGELKMTDEEKQKGKSSFQYYDCCNLTRSSDTNMAAVFVIERSIIIHIFNQFIDKYKNVFISTYYYERDAVSNAINAKYYKGKEVYINKSFDCSNYELYEFQHKEEFHRFELVKTTDEFYRKYYIRSTEEVNNC